MTITSNIRVVAAEIERDGTFLITQRRPEAILPLLWGSGGRVEDGEADEVALLGSFRSGLGWRLRSSLSMFIKHDTDYVLDFASISAPY